ncbi:PREDICTED: odorant receptor 67a-like [Habropoda laboriosa]|uniref:odorant receptor 67a-like n=1 Tax=Habropoda laboriosa TaxID=597456 RepID=UPI00083CD05C|nr:PREDICTED: odorant receptor 67a-like [Habropoda laboriosa]
MKVSVLFTFLSIGGCWRPISWSSTYKTAIYNVYTVLVLIMGVNFMVSQFGSMFTIETVQDFVDLTYICVSVFVGCCKLSNVVFYRKDIIDLMNIFMEDPCACSNKEEDQVQARYDDQLRSITSENKGVLRRCIRHHDRIYRLAEIMNDSLQLTMFAQFFGSFMVICLSLIQLLNADILSTEFLATIFYLSSILLQSFLYCWYGNESVDLADVMFHVDWTGLSEKGRKIILFAMTRTRSPILFESVHVITVNIDFFVVVSRTLYLHFSRLDISNHCAKRLLFLMV